MLPLKRVPPAAAERWFDAGAIGMAHRVRHHAIWMRMG